MTYMIHICLPYKDTTCIPRFHVVLKKNAHGVFEGVLSFIYSVNYLFVTLGLYLFLYIFFYFLFYYFHSPYYFHVLRTLLRGCN